MADDFLQNRVAIPSGAATSLAFPGCLTPGNAQVLSCCDFHVKSSGDRPVSPDPMCPCTAWQTRVQSPGPEAFPWLC